MIETLCDFKNGSLVDNVYELIAATVAEKHNISVEDLVEYDTSQEIVFIYREKYQDEINNLYDYLETILIDYLNE